MHAHVFALCLYACTYCSKSEKIIVNIHWTILSNFDFPHHPQIMHSLKAITKYRNMHAHCACIHAHIVPNFFWCILETYSMFIPYFVKIWVNLAEKLRCVTLSKLHACFHAVCIHANICRPTTIINQLRRPNLKYAEIFVKIWLHLPEILRYDTIVTKTWQSNKQTQLKFILDNFLKIFERFKKNRPINFFFWFPNTK